MRELQCCDIRMVCRGSEHPSPHEGGQQPTTLPTSSPLCRDILAETEKTQPGERTRQRPPTTGTRKFAHSHRLSPTISWLQLEGKACCRDLCPSPAACPDMGWALQPLWNAASRGEAGQGRESLPSLCTFGHSWSLVFAGSLNSIIPGKKEQKISPSPSTATAVWHLPSFSISVTAPPAAQLQQSRQVGLLPAWENKTNFSLKLGAFHTYYLTWKGPSFFFFILPPP